MGLQILTANRLEDGRVVYLGELGWTLRIREARAAADEAGVQELREAGERAVACRDVVDPYLIEVVERAGSRMPVRLRERIRNQGPTVRPDLGYQAGKIV